jgi:hypothetical protein
MGLELAWRRWRVNLSSVQFNPPGFVEAVAQSASGG